MNTIRVGATIDPPYAESCYYRYPNFCFNPGYNIEFIYIVLSNMIGLNVHWVNYANYSDLDIALDNDDVDINGLVYAYDQDSTTRWNYSMPVFSSTIGLVVKTHIAVKESMQLLLLSFFDLQLWLMIIATSIFVILWKKMVTAILTKSAPSAKVANLLFVVWFIMFSIILNLFGNLIAVDLILPNAVTATPFQTVQELGGKLLNKECRFVMFKINENATEFYDVLFTPKHNKSWSENFRTAFEVNPPLFVNSKDELIKVVKDNDCMVGVDYAQLNGISYYDNYCGIKSLTFLDEFEFSYYAYFYRNPNLINLFDKVITTDSFYAFSQKVAQRYYPRATVNCKTITNTGVLNLSKLFDCFAILLFGIALSSAAFILQNILSLRKYFWTKTSKFYCKFKIYKIIQ